MVINDIDSAGPFLGAGQYGAFPIGFRFLTNDHLVFVLTSASGAETTIPPSDWSATGAGSEIGGVATLVNPLLAGTTLTINRVVPATQLTDYIPGDSFPAESHEDALDKLTMIAQQQGSAIDGCLRVPETAAVLNRLPVAAIRAGKFVAFDSAGQPLAIGLATGDSTDLALRLADGSDPLRGAALVAYNPSLAYPVGSVGDALKSPSTAVSHRVFLVGYLATLGGNNLGTANCRPALVAAIAAVVALGGGFVELGQGTFRVDSSFTIPYGVILTGQGFNVTTIKRGFTGDFITSCGVLSGLRDLAIDGDTATRGAGRGILIPSGSYGIVHFAINVLNFSGSCLEFASDGGSAFRSFGSFYYTTATSGTAAAIKMAGNDTQAIPRHFYGTEGSGCTLYDFGGALDTFVSGGYSNGLLFGAASSKVFISNMRIGAAGGTTTIKGTEHQLTNIVFAAPVVLDTGTTSVRLDGETPAWLITDNGIGNNVIMGGSADYTPTWTGSVTPFLGNGILKGVQSRKGSLIKGFIDLTIGSTTNVAGSGAWFFALPRVDNTSYVQCSGQFMVQGTSALVGVTRPDPGSSRVAAFYVNGGALTQLGEASRTWAAGDTLRLSFEYLCS